jgi:hypothetical protein
MKAKVVVRRSYGNMILAGQAHGSGCILLQADLNIFDHSYISLNDIRHWAIGYYIKIAVSCLF